MKKQFLLAVLPALLVLSACSAGPKKANNILLEDALAHEEIFGEVGNAIDLRVRKTAAQENNDEVSTQPVGAAKSLATPPVGVQYQPLTNGKYAIRYVAAINDLDVSAVWTRNICEASGDRIKTDKNQVPVTKAYTALASDGGVDLPAANQYYVVYTLREIPEADLNSYLFAYLTITKGEESVKSLARISRVSGGDTFTIDTTSRHGYFLHGNINGQEFVDVDDDGSAGGNWIQETGIQMKAEDEFGLFKYEPADLEGNGEHFQCFGTYGNDANNYCRSNGNGGKKVFHNGSYNLYVSKNSGTNNVVYFGGTISAERLYLDATVWKNDNPRFALYAFNNAKTEIAWFDMSLVSGNVYKVDVANYSKYDQVIFCRMDPANTTNDWSNKWNQSYDLGIKATSALDRKYAISSYNGNDACPGQWYNID